MKSNDSKKLTKESREPEIGGFSYDEFFNNQLSLPAELKADLNGKGLDWRFINAAQFRSSGNVHRSHWKPYIVEKSSDIAGLTTEGTIQRGDLVLAVRDKRMSKAHRAFLDKRNSIQSGYNKEAARSMRKAAKEFGVDQQVKVFEGYEEND